MMPDAYARFDAYKSTDPQLYKALLRCLVEPKVIKRIDDFVEHIYRKGPPKTRINMKSLLWYEDRLRASRGDPKRETTVTLKRKGEDEKVL